MSELNETYKYCKYTKAHALQTNFDTRSVDVNVPKLWWWNLYFTVTQTAYSEILDYDNPDCIVDDSLPPDEEGNYVDCNTPEALADNRTKCCDIEGEKGCCENKTS